MISILSTLILALGATPAPQADLEAPEGGYSFHGDVDYVQILEQTLRMTSYIETPDPQEMVRLFTSADASAMRQVGAEFIMLEASGPGMIAKMHLHRGGGTLRFYVDGAAEPSWQVEASDLFSSQGPIPRPLVRTIDGLNICTLPMPFNSSVRVTTTDSELAYEIAVRKMGKGVTVPSWSKDLLDDSSGILHRTASSMAANANPTGIRASFFTGGVSRPFPFKFFLHGNGIVQWLTFSFIGTDGPTEEELAEYLRHMRLKIYENFDDKENLKLLVDVPFGDFFGTAPGTSTFNSWGLSQISTAMPTFTVRYPMPYVGGFGIRIEAMRKLPKTVRLRLDVGFQQKLEPPEQRFRANFFQMRGLETRPVRDIDLGSMTGPGRFLGSTLTVLNPVKEQWGLGAVSISVDGEAAPSWKSTDAYTYFERTTRKDGPFDFGFNSLTRTFLNDAIPFHQELKVGMELKHEVETTVDLEGVLYWYGPTEATTPGLAASPEDLQPQQLPEFLETQVVGALEAEEFRVNKVTGEGEMKTSTVVPAETSGAMLAWTGAQKGNYAKLNFDVASAGNWETEAYFFTYPGGPKVALYLNGKKTGPSIDLNADEAGWKAFGMGVHMLSNREHLLTVALESEPGESEFPPICIDFLRLTMK
ncbi:MAG: DUF2961 domain-containing protein [Planctomycetes bacterium]|nr:DUF2961 domain-containing protein [Planctomycetota bacterium]